MNLGADSLLTTTQVLSLTRRRGPLRLPKRIFDQYVASGVAPQPVARRGGEPLWERRQVDEWAEGELQSLLDTQGRRLLIAQGRNTVTPAFPALSTIRLDSELPTHAAVLHAELELVRGLEDVARGRREVSRRLARLPATEEPASPSSWTSRLRKRPATTSEVRSGLLQDRDALTDLERRLSADLGSCRAWTYELLAWAEAEALDRRVGALEETYLRDEEVNRRVDFEGLTLFASPEAFVAGDARRLARYDHGPIGEDQRMVLAGADFGHAWRHDDTDSDLRSRPGTWRVSWIQSSGEMYCVERAGGVVVLIGTARTTFDRLADWMLDLENRQAEPNSLTLVLDAFREQERAGFPTIPPIRSLEGW